MLQCCLKVCFMLCIIIQLCNNALNACSILPCIAQEKEFTEVVDASNILPDVAQKNVFTDVITASNISTGTARENRTTEVIDALKFLPGIQRENGTTEVVDAPNSLPKQNFEFSSRSCYNLQKLGGVCKNEDGIIIESDPVSNVKEIYEITFNDTKYLPARVLFGFSVQCLYLDDPDVDIDEDVFEGIVQLREFIVLQSSIQAIPDFKFVKDTIETINIQSTFITSLEGKNLQNLTKVMTMLFTNNSIRFIDPDVFKGTENIVTLDLSWNRLTSIPPNLLDPMKKLIEFFADHNNLLHVDNLFSMMSSLEYIDLDSNNITDVESVLYSTMKNVRRLNLSRNPIKNLTVNSFHGKIDNVQELSLIHCELQTFSLEYFYELDDLRTLDLSYNLIEEASDAYSEDFNNKNDSRISLELERLNLIGNKLKSISKILKFKQINNLQVSKNQIQYLSDEDFKFLHATKILQLQENLILRIDTDTFKPIRGSLRGLDLSHNSISSLNRSITYLTQLRILFLTNNIIQFFARDEFLGLDALTHLYLGNNNIKKIKADQMPKKLKQLDLTGNNLKCDCSFLPFLYRLDSIEIEKDLCLRPRTLPKNSNCPGLCSCKCNNSEKDDFMFVDCSSKMEGNETMTVDSRGNLLMKDNIYPLFDIEDRVLGVNLENNSLESLEGIQLPPDLIELYLANNNLRWLPDSILINQLNFKKVSLSGNPWNCDCSALKFKRWLTFLGPKIIEDIEHVRCGTSGKTEGKSLWTLTDYDLCPKDSDLIVSVCLSVLTVAILCVATILLFKKYKLKIKAFLYSHGFTFVKEKNLNHEKAFDVFLSFCHEDDKFVIEEIISVIEEKDPNIRLCIHYRHFMAGEYIYDNIIWAVQNSKRTVVILSKKFLESEWCLMEFRTAHMQTLEDKVHRIIVIKVGDLPKEIPPALKAYLDSTTYLTWGETNFWNKLFCTFFRLDKELENYYKKHRS